VKTLVQPRPPVDDPASAELEPVGFLGVEPVATVTIPTGGPWYTLDRMGEMTVDSLKALGQLPVKVWEVAQAIVGVRERGQDSPVSIVGGGRLAGEVVSSDELTAGDATGFLLVLIGGFNLFLGLFNLLPLLPLDGGHIAGALYEAARRGIARVRGRPDPGYVDVARLLPVAYAVGAALLVMGLVLIVGDLVVPVRIT
jgi:membrane-associated protease RseP (regulator of RpoE activity)